MTSRWRLDEKHIGQKVKNVGKKMQQVSKQIIVLNLSDFDTKEIITLSVDCVNYPTTEFRLDPGVEWFDHKSHGPGLKYKYGVTVHHVSTLKYLCAPLCIIAPDPDSFSPLKYVLKQALLRLD